MNLGTAALVAALTAGLMVVVSRWKRTRKPTRWVPVGEVSRLCIYPLKSGKAVDCDTVRCGPTGVEVGEAKDRMFLVVDSTGRVKSGREYPRMTQIVAEVTSGRLRLSGPDSPNPVELTLPPNGGRVAVRYVALSLHPNDLVEVSPFIWDAPAEGLDCGDDVSTWLTNYLQAESPLRLLYRGDDVTGKALNPGMKKALRMLSVAAENSDAGLFSDTFSYHLVSESSVDDLNRRMDGHTVSALNFRPNIVVKGEALLPFEEDRWEWVKIGDVVFRYLAPCMRCSFTTIDPATAVRSEGREPITTMKRYFRYRLVRDSKLREVVYTPTMGIYVGARGEGSISVGDVVAVPEVRL